MTKTQRGGLFVCMVALSMEWPGGPLWSGILFWIARTALLLFGWYELCWMEERNNG